MAEISTEMDMYWPEGIAPLSGTDMTSDCIDCRPNIDGTLDYTPVPLALKNLWLFKNGGERNEVC
ncbi:MAG: hypothetical protein M0Q91_17055 [Methanoregula sp.]|nr:hypothetical protein [Methanoregula sp.]